MARADRFSVRAPSQFAAAAPRRRRDQRERPPVRGRPLAVARLRDRLGREGGASAPRLAAAAGPLAICSRPLMLTLNIMWRHEVAAARADAQVSNTQSEQKQRCEE